MQYGERTIGSASTAALSVAPVAILEKQRSTSARREAPSVPSGRSRHAAIRDDDDDDHDVALDAVDPVDADEIGIVVAHIRRLTRAASLEFALRVGAVIIHHFYGGDTNTWRSRGAKTMSFRRLAAHPDLPLSAGSLYRCVAIYELCDRLNAASRWEHLGASHLRLVLGMPPEMQESILSTANAERWSVKTLQQEVSFAKIRRPEKGGRKPQSPIQRSLMAVRGSLDVCWGAVADTLPREEVESTLQLIEDAKASVEHFSRCLRAAARSNGAVPESGKQG
jgi:hypothetical protein